MDYTPQLKQPKSWNALVNLMPALGDCHPLELRLPQDEHFYEVYSEIIPNDIKLDILKSLIGNKTIILIKNNFPYSRLLEYLPTVRQYCLWSINGQLANKEINKFVNKTFPDKKWCQIVRAPGSRSVPEIWHCHIFVEMYNKVT